MKKLRFMFIAGVTGVLWLTTQYVFANPGEDSPKQPPIEVVETDEEETVNADAFEPGKWVDKAVVMLEEQMTKSPDKRIPQTHLALSSSVCLLASMPWPR